MKLNNYKFLNIFIFLFNTVLYGQLPKIGFLSSWKIKCGIASYTEHHYNALKKKGFDVNIINYNLTLDQMIEEIKKNKIDILHIQYERGFFPNIEISEFVKFMQDVKNKLGVKIVVTFHSEENITIRIARASDHAIYHKLPQIHKYSETVSVIPHGIPVFETKDTRETLRKKYGFSNDDIILTTFGFLMEWKQHANVLGMLAPLIKKNKKIKVQLLTSINDFCVKLSEKEAEKIKNIIDSNKINNQVIHITDFLPQREVAERLFLSDLGYLWCPFDTNSSSGAFKEFISARLPLVASDSNHYCDNDKSIIRSPKNMKKFIDTIIENLINVNNLKQYRLSSGELYNSLNYDAIILKHIEIYMRLYNFPK